MTDNYDSPRVSLSSVHHQAYATVEEIIMPFKFPASTVYRGKRAENFVLIKNEFPTI